MDYNMFCSDREMIDDLDFEWLFDVEHGEWGKYLLQWQSIAILSFFFFIFFHSGIFFSIGEDRSVSGKVTEVHQKT